MTAVIYARYSSDNQREESIEGQLRECKEYAKKENIDIIDTYIDRALSARTDKRPSFQKMVLDSKNRLFDIVIVWKLDRFSRDRYNSAFYKKILKDNGVKVVSATEQISDGPEGVMLESLLEGMAEYYSVELAEKVNRGLTENALKCKFNGGTLPFGYIITKDQQFEIDNNVAPYIRNAFQMYAGGKRIEDIIDYFNQHGIKTTRGTQFKPTAISYMLKNRKYIGEYKYRNVIKENGVPVIVDKVLFDRVQERMKKNHKSAARFSAVANYALSTKLYCGKCHSLMIGECGTSRNGKVYNYYKCNSSKRKKGCTQKAVSKDLIETAIMDELNRVLLDDDFISDVIDKILEFQKNDKGNLPVLKKNLNAVNKKIDNILNAIEQGVLTSSTKNRLNVLEDEKTNIEKTIAEEQNSRVILTKEKLEFWFFKLRKLDINNPEQQKLLIENFLNYAVVYDDKIELHLNYKENTSDVSIINFSKCSTKKKTTPPRQRG